MQRGRESALHTRKCVMAPAERKEEGEELAGWEEEEGGGEEEGVCLGKWKRHPSEL